MVRQDLKAAFVNAKQPGSNAIKRPRHLSLQLQLLRSAYYIGSHKKLPKRVREPKCRDSRAHCSDRVPTVGLTLPAVGTPPLQHQRTSLARAFRKFLTRTTQTLRRNTMIVSVSDTVRYKWRPAQNYLRERQDNLIAQIEAIRRVGGRLRTTCNSRSETRSVKAAFISVV